MPTVETSIWLALRARVEALVLTPALPVAWPNESFTKQDQYLRVTHIPNINRRVLIGSAGPHRRLGLLQIDVFVKKNQNAAVAAEIAGLVAAHFPVDQPRMMHDAVSVRVTEAPVVTQAIDDETHWMVPVTISYECFA